MIPVDWTSLFEPTLASTRGLKSGQVTALRNSRKVRIAWGRLLSRRYCLLSALFRDFRRLDRRAVRGGARRHQVPAAQGLGFLRLAGAHARARPLRPTRFGDDVMIESSINFGRSSFEIEHRLSHNGVTCGGVLGEAGMGGARCRHRRHQIASGARGGAGEVRGGVRLVPNAAPSAVMAGLVPAISLRQARCSPKRDHRAFARRRVTNRGRSKHASARRRDKPGDDKQNSRRRWLNFTRSPPRCA